MFQLILRSFQSPGDILMMSAAVRDLQKAHPGRFVTDVRTSAPAIWENNPYLTPLQEGDAGVTVLQMHYPAIHQSNQRPYHFIHGYVQFLEQHLDLRIPVTRFCGDIHLSEAEKEAPPPGVEHGVPKRFWIVIAGGKYDFTAKWWNPASYQVVVDHFRDRITFVQCGEQGHWHPRLTGVVDLVGKTSLRDFIRLVYHADGVLCPVTLAMHLAAAVEPKPDGPSIRACVVVAGGREPAHWEAYPNHQFISTNGSLPCCAQGGCWRSRCQPVGDGDAKDKHNVCEKPVHVREDLCIPACMDMITPDDVIRRVEMYYRGLALEYCDGRSKVTAMVEPGAARSTSQPQPPHPAAPPHAERTSRRLSNVLIKFRHGLGDAVQLTSVLQHLTHERPDWHIEVAALIGKHSAYDGLCDQVSILDREPPKSPRIDRQLDLDWLECTTCYSDSPGTKADRCLREVFNADFRRPPTTNTFSRGSRVLLGFRVTVC